MTKIDTPHFTVQTMKDFNKRFPYFAENGLDVTDNGLIVTQTDDLPDDHSAWLEYLKRYASLQTDRVLLGGNDIYLNGDNVAPIFDVAHCLEHLILASDSLWLDRSRIHVNSSVTQAAWTIHYPGNAFAGIGFRVNIINWENILNALKSVTSAIISIDTIKEELEICNQLSK